MLRDLNGRVTNLERIWLRCKFARQINNRKRMILQWHHAGVGAGHSSVKVSLKREGVLSYYLVFTARTLGECSRPIERSDHGDEIDRRVATGKCHIRGRGH